MQRKELRHFPQSTESQDAQGKSRDVVQDGWSGSARHRSSTQSVRQGLKTEGVVEHGRRQMLKADWAIFLFKQKKENIAYSVSIEHTGCVQRNKIKARTRSH